MYLKHKRRFVVNIVSIKKTKNNLHPILISRRKYLFLLSTKNMAIVAIEYCQFFTRIFIKFIKVNVKSDFLQKVKMEIKISFK